MHVVSVVQVLKDVHYLVSCDLILKDTVAWYVTEVCSCVEAV